MRYASLGMLALAALCGASSAMAAGVQRSGDVFHKAACGFVVGPVARCHARVITDAHGRLLTGRQPVGGYGPPDLRSAYKITTDGSPSTIVAIVDAFGYDNAESDLAVYRANFGLPACTTAGGCFRKMNQKGQQKNYPPQNIGWAQESALDLDMASAMCPNCQIWLIEATTNSFKSLTTAVDEAAVLGAHVISNSYGGEDSKASARWESHYDHSGVAITASSGDSGYGVQFPASSPHVIAVGGTHLIRDGSERGWAETVWHGAGSGCSEVFDKPSWQPVFSIGIFSCGKRMVADVSADADPATGVAVYGPNASGVSTWLIFGGTSVGAPLIGGVFGNNGGAVDAASTLYLPGAKLFDVTAGSNGTCLPAYLCNGEVGYDGPTGMGTPNGITAF